MATITLKNGQHAAIAVRPSTTVSDTVNAYGHASLAVSSGAANSESLTVNLGAHASLAMSFSQMTFGALTVNGGPQSGVVFNGASYIGAMHAVIHAPVSGTGSIEIASCQSGGDGTLEIGSSVSAGETVIVAGSPWHVRHPTLTIDHPEAFHGVVEFGAAGTVTLLGLHGATSYDIRQDMLHIYSGSKVIDSLRLKVDPSQPNTAPMQIGVHQSAAGVVINNEWGGGGALGLLAVHS